MRSELEHAEMVGRLRGMASQILSPRSEGKRFFESVAEELERLRRALEADWSAPVEELKGTFPVVLYFATDADRAEFIELMREAKPGMRTVPLEE